MARSTLQALGELVDLCSQRADLGQDVGFAITAALALRTRDEPARDRRRDDREQCQPAEQQERGDDGPTLSCGTTSPYPTVVTVCRAHHIPSHTVGNV